MNLEEFRLEIDRIDEQITALFEKRMKVVIDVAKVKKEQNLPVLHQNRELEVIQKNKDRLKDKSLSMELEEFYVNLMKISRQYQRRMMQEKEIVGYQGVDGAFTHKAVLDIFSSKIEKNLIDIKDYREFGDVFDALNRGDIDYGVLPIENSSTGSINQNYDYLYKNNCYIQGEYALQAEQTLMAVEGATLDTIKRVYSHPQGFSQSTKFLSKYSDWELIPYYNTAISAKYVKEQNDISLAAIASKEAARIYGLNILAEDIIDNKKNYTRFIKIGKELVYDERSDKISLVMGLDNKPGTLFSALAKINNNGLNMINIESRPIANRPWEYMFYIDIEGNLGDEKVKNTLEQIQKESRYFRILGCYKREVF